MWLEVGCGGVGGGGDGGEDDGLWVYFGEEEGKDGCLELVFGELMKVQERGRGSRSGGQGSAAKGWPGDGTTGCSALKEKEKEEDEKNEWRREGKGYSIYVRVGLLQLIPSSNKLRCASLK